MRSVMLVLAGVVALLLVVLKWPEPQARSQPESLHDTGLARDLLARGSWQSHEMLPGHLHYRALSDAAGVLPQLSDSIVHARQKALVFLETVDTLPIEIFLVSSRQEMEEAVGRPIGGMVRPGERTAVLLYNRSYSPFMAHELTHLFMLYHWGPARNGRWIVEGAAALVSGDCQGHSIAALVKGLQEDGRLQHWPEFVGDFDRLDEVAANLQAASMVEFVWSRSGITAVRDLWASAGWSEVERALGEPVARLEAEWLQRVHAGPPSARLDVARLYRHGCIS